MFNTQRTVPSTNVAPAAVACQDKVDIQPERCQPVSGLLGEMLVRTADIAHKLLILRRTKLAYPVVLTTAVAC